MEVKNQGAELQQPQGDQADEPHHEKDTEVRFYM